MKKLIFVIVFVFISSLIFGNEKSVLRIRDSGVENIRRVGYELCRLYTKNDKSYWEKFKDSLWDDEEENLARKLAMDSELQNSIFCGKASEDWIIHKLQDGCFDFFIEDVESHFTEFFTVFSAAYKCMTPDDIYKETMEKTHDEIYFPGKLMLQLGRPERFAEFNKKLARSFADTVNMEEEL
ncbi:MAG: hypothetical protein C5B43_04365 [Verrucomicrobia bacterium]|nr:MAG: hypothetical protein C5B43_04365 [Verrucomicrobiota bacterium]